MIGATDDLSDAQRALLKALDELPRHPERLELERRTRAGEFDDFRSEHPNPIGKLVAEFTRMGANALAKRAMMGEFDGTAEDGERWAVSPEGRKITRQMARDLGMR